ncbi:MAG: HAMP domain-containing histidine kinase [Clostridiales bacterium]|nr:HAMP domain-containing histidine kinase [Clostridiales bacterium]
MATELRGWTARRPVKICCVILIPVMMFISLYGVAGLARLDYMNFELLLADLDSNEYFYDRYIPNALTNAHSFYWLQSEEHIRDLGCLEWQPSGYYSYVVPDVYTGYEDYDDYPKSYAYNEPVDETNGEGQRFYIDSYNLVSKNRTNQWAYGSVSAENMDTPGSRSMEVSAINQQLREFHNAKNALNEMRGLSFFITDGDRWAGNVPPGTGVEFFRSQPVFWISENGEPYEQSHKNTRNSSYNAYDYYYYDYGYGYTDDHVMSGYAAFSNEAVDQQNGIWSDMQRQMKTQMVMFVLPLIAALALFIVLVAGAGRKPLNFTPTPVLTASGPEYPELKNKTVHFTILDKPWLDIGLCILAGFEALIIFAFIESASIAWQYGNMQWFYALCAALSVLTTLPLLGWLMNLSKRCKAGRFWRHTLVYALIHNVAAALKRYAKSLWAGFPLTLRAVLIGLALFLLNLFSIALYHAWILGPALAFFVNAFVVFCLLRYSRKLYLLQQGAKAAGEGRYGAPIAVTGGELGSIADSINNISDGINAAVTERMKSERMKTELITNISHDIRTPITSLITYTDLLKSEGLHNEKAPEYLEVLIQKSARLKALTDDLFEASKAASGNIEVHMEDLDLADFVRQVLGELDERLRASGLDFRLDLPDHAPVRADGKLLWRVMENLLSNVFKYTLPGSRVYVDITPENGGYRLDMKNISENPLNIDPAELTERFKRGDESRTGDGSGLGLSIAQSFVFAQGGRFELSIDGDLFKASLYLAKV